MAKLIQGNGRNERINGAVIDFSGVTVTTADTVWTDRVSNCSIAHTNAFTNTSNEISVTATGGSLSYDGTIPVPKANQKILIGFSAYFNAGNNSLTIGDDASGVGVGVKTGLSYLTIDASNYFTFSAMTTDISALDMSFFIVLDLENGTATKYLYDDTGVVVESVEGVLTGTVDSFDLSADVIFKIVISTTLYRTKSITMNYFDSVPSDLTDGLEWMSANPTLGGYPVWREI